MIFHMYKFHTSFSRSNLAVMFSLHGLVRGENMELGRDSDTGGQVTTLVHAFIQTRIIISFILIR